MGLFSKGGSSSPPPMPDYSGMMQQQTTMFQEMMGGMMSMMEGIMASMPDMTEYMSSMQESMLLDMPDTPALLDMPTVERGPDIDWTEKQNQLASKARADFNLDAARRKGVTDTIHTSPLLDEEEANTSGSIIAGS